MILADLNQSLRTWRDAVLQVPGPLRLSEFAGYCMALSEILIADATEKNVVAGKPISCRKGCTHCCFQVIPVSPAEAFYLIELLTDSVPPDSSKSIWARRVLDQFQKNRDKIQADSFGERAYFQQAKEYFSLEMPCPFLVENACSIYPNRPHACREHLVFSNPEHCQKINSEDVHLLDMPLSVRDALALVVAEALGTCQEMIPMTHLFAWAKENEKVGTSTFETKYLVDLLVKKILGERQWT